MSRGPAATWRMRAAVVPSLAGTHPDLKRVSLLVAACGAGLLMVGIADETGRRGRPSELLFWLGLLVVYVPIAVRVLSRDVARAERLALVCLLGVTLYCVKVLAAPSVFASGDEFIHLRSTEDILRTHHLFAANPLLPTAAYYPGLAAATAGVVDLTGLSPVASALIVIAAGRLLISACLYLVAEAVTRSAHAAAAASLVYAANPSFTSYSTTFTYENLALPLAAFTVWWLGRLPARPGPARLAPAVLAIVAVTVTHHLVAFALAAVLAAWWLAMVVTRRGTSPGRVGALAIFAAGSAAIWLLAVARPAASYLFVTNFYAALRELVRVLTRQAAVRSIFVSGAAAAPEWERVVSFLSIFVLLVALPPALYAAWRRRDRPSLLVAAGVALLYPLSLVARVAPLSVGIAGRSSEYVFAGLACILGALVGQRLARWSGRRPAALAALLAAFVFVGGVAIGTPFNELLPEAYGSRGYPWTVQPDVIAASVWAREHLGVNQRFAATTVDSDALATYGGQYPVPEGSVWPIFFGETMNANVVAGIRSTGVRYLLIDWRMTYSVPSIPGYYFSVYEPRRDNPPLGFEASALRKFSSTTCARVIYDSGPIQIVDVTAIADGSCRPVQHGPG